MIKKQNSQSNQDGFASIIIALILILVLSLMTVGFAQLARREQQSALDKQVANQAYYAAESGINDAELGIWGNSSAGIAPTITETTPNVNTDKCLNTPFVPNANNHLSNTYNVYYSCVLVTLDPPIIQYDNVGKGSDRYLTFNTDSVGPTSDFTIQWGSPDGHNNYPNDPSTKFLPAATWSDPAHNYPSVLQISITPLNNTSRQALTTNTMTAVLYPARNGVGSVAYSSYLLSPYAAGSALSTEGSIISGGCNPAGGGGRSPTYPCQATITGVPGGTGSFLIHIYNMPYDASNVIINGHSAGVPIKFKDGQAVVDSTGRDKNVAKRLRVTVPLHRTGQTPNFPIEGQTVCKRFDTFQSSTTPDGSIAGCDFN